MAGPEAGVGVTDSDLRRLTRRFRHVQALHDGFQGPERSLEIPLHLHVPVIQAGRQARLVTSRPGGCARADDQARGLPHKPGDQSAHDRSLGRRYPLAQQRQPFAQVGVRVQEMARPHVRKPTPPIPSREPGRVDRQGVFARQPDRIADKMDRLLACRRVESLFARTLEVPDGRSGLAGLPPMVRQ